jgi:hypothetical protein
MADGGLKVHSEEFDRLSRGLEGDARVSEHHNAQGNQNDRNNVFGVHVEFTIKYPRLKRRFPAGDDSEQDRQNGEEEQYVNQVASGAGHHSQRP